MTSETPTPPKKEAGKTSASDSSNEHPLSALLFAPLRGEGAQTTILWGLAGVCIGLAIMGFFIEPGHHFPLEAVPVFYGLFGAAAFSAAVLSGWPLGKWLRRPEGFYTSKSANKPETEDTAGEAGSDA